MGCCAKIAALEKKVAYLEQQLAEAKTTNSNANTSRNDGELNNQSFKDNADATNSDLLDLMNQMRIEIRNLQTRLDRQEDLIKEKDEKIATLENENYLLKNKTK